LNQAARIRAWITAAALIGSLAGSSALAAMYEAIEIIPTRPNVTVRLLVIKPSVKASTALLLFPGNNGSKHFGEHEGRFWVSRNFLMRTARDFASMGYLVVAVDTPSDQKSGMADAFRMSACHAEDVRKILAHLKERHRASAVYLAGTSRGTISASYLASVFENTSIAGVILASTVSPAELGGVDLADIDNPVLIVQHARDECRSTPLQAALSLKANLTESPRVDLVQVTGGLPPASGACEALSPHGFYGTEQPVLRVIGDWIQGKAVPEKIGK